MLTNILVAGNIGIAIANGFILMRCWRTMRKVDKMHDESADILLELLALRKRFQELNPDYVDPTDE